MKLTSKASIQIQKTIEDVFEGIVHPSSMTQYFISESTGRLESGQNVFWKFPEFDDQFEISKVEINAHHSISFVWDPETIVMIKLEEQADKSTVVHVTEGSKENNQANIQWLISNSAGWSNFLTCMKAYLEYGICLRKGAYDFMRKDISA